MNVWYGSKYTTEVVQDSNEWVSAKTLDLAGDTTTQGYSKISEATVLTCFTK